MRLVNQYLRRNLGYKQKIQAIRRNQVYFQRFEWYNSHCQGLDAEWKVYILFQNYYQMQPN